MALPAGAATATVTVGAPIDIAGAAGTLVSLHIRPDLPGDTPLVWAADGTPIQPWSASPAAGESPVTSASLEVLADQPGVLTSSTVDGAAAMVEIRSWPLVAVWVTRQSATGAPTRHVRHFNAPAAGTTVDLDMLPADGVTVPATVTYAQTINIGGAGIDTEGIQDVVGAMVAAAGGTYDDAAGTITLPGGTASAAITADDTPAAPAEGESASYFVTSAVVWPAGLVWSTDPDGGVAPTITGTALVSMFTVDGTTRAIVGATFPTPPDTVAPVAGTLAASSVDHGSFVLTVTGASDAGGFGATPYAFSTDNGSTYSAWQASPSFTASGMAPETAYTCRHKVRDAATNESAGAAITVATSAAPAPVGLDAAITALSPVGYWKLNETSGTQATDYSGNGRHGTYTGSYTLGGQNGFVSLSPGGYVEIPDADDFSIPGTGMTFVALVRSTSYRNDRGAVVSKADAGSYEWRMGVLGSDVGQGSVRMQAAAWSAPNGNNAATCTTRPSETPVPLNTWHLAVWTIPDPDAQSTVLYSNGIEQVKTFETSIISAPLSGSAPVRIGVADGLSMPLYGAVGHVAIIPGGLTAGQVAVLTDAARAEGLIA